MSITTAPTHVLWTGDFGERVAGHLETMTGGPSLRADVRGRWSAEWPHTGLRLVATWRHEPALLDRVARVHSACRTPWLPIVHEYPVIRVGPLVVPRGGPCHDCYLKRRAQHDRSPSVTQALRASLAADPDSGVSGFTDAQARMAAALATDLVHRYRTSTGARPGRVVFYNVLTRTLVGDTVVGVHGCGECGTPPHPDDGWRHLAADLAADAPEGNR
ncbi:TOMM precursor leader peptide-binding protein [Streptomyces sp. ISL-10]|uniref:TOMM precursor leader peptide-binding protein n=1 Tax=Streptomyces sp. ISL-10 TaxID=2819172 RepID=UPI001BE9086D|nr:TOMM precursor leader peptide-binding protein [Streptomyces sp. ISL-10]MBT2365426.1 TOMM precursor leader peptide-binding protein [Streptomyces sp. ISL-10]